MEREYTCSGSEEEALKRNVPALKKLLRKKCWSHTERWMIQSWYDNGVKLLTPSNRGEQNE